MNSIQNDVQYFGSISFIVGSLRRRHQIAEIGR